MSQDHQHIKTMQNFATVEGEISSATADSITISGWFGGGVAIQLRPGARVFVLNEDDTVNLINRHQELPCGGACLE